MKQYTFPVVIEVPDDVESRERAKWLLEVELGYAVFAIWVKEE